MLRILISVLILFGFYGSTGFAKSGRIYINVGEAKLKKSLVALPAFQFYGSNQSQNNLRIGQNLFAVITNDLNASALFSFIDQGAFLEDPAKVGLKPAPGAPNGFNFNNWKTIGTEFLVRGGYKVLGDRISFEVYVYYVPHAKQVFGGTYEGKSSAIRKIAHKFADDFIKNLTGKRGMFSTRIVATVGRGVRSGKSVHIMDWDGKNKQKITKQNLAISPAISRDGKHVAYTAWSIHKRGRKRERNGDLYTFNTETNKTHIVSYRKGMNSGAAFFPSGRHILLSMTRGKGGADIYRINRDGGGAVRLTRGPGRSMNVEPSISSDGRKIAFSSDRGGRPMIYVMNANGSSVRRVTDAGRYNSSPSWSPDGSKIAFASLDFKKKTFDIFVISVDGWKIERLTSARKTNGKWSNNEDPTFSPDGRHIMFVSDRSGNKQLYMINPDGTNERRITYDNFNYEKPKWSGFLD